MKICTTTDYGSKFMKRYPEIPYKISDIPVYCFDKLDGSNIRAEWTRKTEFSKFGSRHRLIDKNDSQFGEAVDLILYTYGDVLSSVFREERYTEAVAFFEFYGANSFAGTHVSDEDHYVTLIDVNVYKRGILPPKEFLKLFGHLGIPNMVYYGRPGHDFVESVRNRTLKGITFEGVVCKSMHKNKPLMFKIKTRDWIRKIKDKELGHLLDGTELKI